jgi:heme oxygenase
LKSPRVGSCDQNVVTEAEAVSVRRPSSFPPDLPPSVRERLRHATSAMHEALHTAAPFVGIGAGDPAAYGLALTTLLRFHAAMAPFCRAAAGALGFPEIIDHEDQRIAMLRRDLAVLGIAAALPAAPDGEQHDASAEFAVGCLYTVLGSTLGGKVIDRQLDALLPTAAGREFFRGTPADGILWRLFCARLERYGGDGDRVAGIAAGASFAFARFRQCLEERQ